MKFSDYHHQREVQEMASFSVSGGFVVSCKNFTMYNLNCDDQEIYAVDMRFEDPGAYPDPYNSLSQYSKFSAKIPGSKRYLVYDGAEAKVMDETSAKRGDFVPVRDGMVNKDPGAESQSGFVLVPDNWVLHAQFFNKDYDLIKDALADTTGTRQAALS